MGNSPLYYAIALSLIDGVGSVNAKKLIAYVGSIEGIFKEKKSNLLKIPGIGEQIASDIKNSNTLNLAEQELKFIEKNQIKTYLYIDESYPVRLKQCYDAPIILYVKGEVNLNVDKVISIVGTRNATDYGKSMCDNLIKQLQQKNIYPLVVSGLAYGIDINAHKAALKNNMPTVAVLGHGLTRIYPEVHNHYAQEIMNNGALVTEFTSNTEPDRKYFVRRNRIIAGLADATIVIESGEKGGALITAEIANSYNREVFAIPGRIKDTYSKGCNQLIKANKAILLESANDLIEQLNWEKIENKPKIIQTSLFFDLSDDENRVLEIIRNNAEIPIDFISLESGIPIHKVSSILLNLEFVGLIKSLPGKRYKAI